MDIRFQAGGPSKWKADAVISFVFEGEDAEQACSVLMQNALWLGIAPAWRDFRGKSGEMTMFYGPKAMELIRAAELSNLTPLCRVRDLSRSAVLKLLDVGARGLIVPNIHSVEEVQQIIDYAKFAPIGQRGFCPTRKDGWGFDTERTTAETMAVMNEATLLLPQCETAEALEHIEEIVALEGVDGVFIGPFDLSISMGIPGQFNHPDFVAALANVQKACRDAGKFCMIFAGAPAAVAERFQQGYDSVAYGLDASVLIAAFKANLADIRSKI